MWEIRTEGAGAAREAWAIGIGVFIGCSPLYGLHLLLCWAAGWALGLNRLKMYLAANISNPLFAPVLLFAEVQTGAWIRRSDFHALSLETVRTVHPWTFGADLVVGSLALGATLGAAAGLATYAASKAGSQDVCFFDLVRLAADRYAAASMTAWEFARGKMRGDPLYRTVLLGRVLPASGGTLVDIGCGQGLMLALLAEGARHRERPPGCERPPVFDRLIGIELRARVAAIAARALHDAATIVHGDARTSLPATVHAALLFDVLHMLPAEDQLRLLDAVRRVLDPHGVILVREPDAGAGWSFTAVRLGNRLKALVTANWHQTFHFRSAVEWEAVFQQLGYHVRRHATSEGTPFANVLFVLDRREP
jgi:SAM-dependent methyltransferase